MRVLYFVVLPLASIGIECKWCKSGESWRESGCPITHARACEDNAMHCSRNRPAIFIQGLNPSTEEDPMTPDIAGTHIIGDGLILAFTLHTHNKYKR